MTTVRVLHLQPMSLDLFGQDDRLLGTEIRHSVWNLARAQKGIGLEPEVHLLSRRNPRERVLDGVRLRFHRALEPFPGGPVHRRFARQFSLSMLASVRAGPETIVHFHGADQFHAMFALVAASAHRAGVPLVAQDRGGRDVGAAEGLLQRFGLARSAAVLAASRESASRFAGLGVPAERIRIFENGFDPTSFFPEGARRPSEAGRFRLLSVVRLSAEKDPTTLVDAIRLLVATEKRYHLTLVSDGPMRDRVLAALHETGVPLRFHRRLTQEELGEEYRAADLLLLPSTGEGWSQVAVEAMACGLPVVASDVRGVREAVGEAAVLVEPGSPPAMAEAVTRLTDAAGSLSALRVAGLERAAGFTWTKVAKRSLQFYTAVLRERTVRGGEE